MEIMTFDEILHWCIFRSKGTTAKSAAEYLGITGQQFGHWRNHLKSNKYPTDEMCVRIAQLCDLDPYIVWLAVQSEKCKAPEIKKALKMKVKPRMQTPNH